MIMCGLPGGVRAQPGAEELRTFVDTIGELDGLEVGSLLAEKMVSCDRARGPSLQPVNANTQPSVKA